VRVHTVGHSNVDPGTFIGLLRAHGIGVLVDVRAFPTSRKWPHFSREPLAAVLAEAGIAYEWLGKELGGYRKSTRAGSPHRGLRGMWQAYADHMEGPEFRRGIARLLALAAERPTAVMCAEKLWFRCHRRRIADHLVALERVEIFHILDESPPRPHRVDPRARVENGKLVYDREQQPDLF
jgi:uncharacterized protein (DUF488 family)